MGVPPDLPSALRTAGTGNQRPLISVIVEKAICLPTFSHRAVCSIVFGRQLKAVELNRFPFDALPALLMRLADRTRPMARPSPSRPRWARACLCAATTATQPRSTARSRAASWPPRRSSPSSPPHRSRSPELCHQLPSPLSRQRPPSQLWPPRANSSLV